MRCGFYPGSFDPPTLGHRDIMSRGLALFDRLVIGVGIHPSKAPMFAEADRVAMLKQELDSLGAGERSDVVLFQGLTVDAARKNGAHFILRGIRDAVDLGYEMQLAGMNKGLAPDIETVFLAASSWNRAHHRNARPANRQPRRRCLALRLPSRASANQKQIRSPVIAAQIPP